jgi:hypothetical protein
MKRDKHVTPKPPMIVLKGEEVQAAYLEQEIPDYCGNPLIEALPPIWDKEQVENQLMFFPPYSDEQRDLPAHLRLQLNENVREFFTPRGIDYEIETKVSCILRRGLMMRNPVGWEYQKNFNKRVDSFRPYANRKGFFRFKPRGFAIVGVGGMGKSTSVENILLMYPQVIVHTKYQDQDFILKQLVWLKLDCPQDGSIRGLCINFFLAVDDILGTNYYERYVTARTTVDELMPNMARVASLHCIGVLVIDEIQNLSEAKTGGADRMLNFFVQLENTIGVPFILIGTPDAKPLFGGKFRHARRACENGDIDWKRMDEKIKKTDEELKAEKAQTGVEPDPYKPAPVWQEFVRSLWDYQYVKNKSELDENILNDPAAHALYEASQGITAVAATVFLLAQRRAISTGLEKISKKVIESVARDSQNMIGWMIDGLKQGKKRGHPMWADKNVTDLDIFDAEVEEPPTSQGDKGSGVETQGSGGGAPMGVSETSSMSPTQPAEGNEGNNATDEAATQAEKKKRRARKPRRADFEKDDLRNMKPKKKGSKTVTPSSVKHIKPATEFLD